MAETWSHPGYLTVTFSGKRSSWAICPMCAGEMTAGLGYIELNKFKPPIELELAFVAPDVMIDVVHAASDDMGSCSAAVTYQGDAQPTPHPSPMSSPIENERHRSG